VLLSLHPWFPKRLLRLLRSTRNGKKKILKVLPRRLIGVPVLSLLFGSLHQQPSILIKVNWDGSINKDAGYSTLECAVLHARDHAGNFLGAKSTYQQIVFDPNVVEVMMAALNARSPIL
jgi:hypothetical protein